MNRFRLVLAGLLCLFAGSVTTAQNPYEKIAVVDKEASRKLYRPAVEAVRSKSALSSAQKKAVNDYFLKCAIAPMATPTAFENDGTKLPGFRRTILSALKQGGPAHTEILRLCVQHLIGDEQRPGIARSDSYLPASRLNAMLLITDLNETEVVSSPDRKPKPLGVARTFMAEVVGSSEYPQYLRIAALNGLRRHAACGVANKSMMQAVLKILDEENPSHMPPEAITWQKRLAIETMGLMRHPGFAKFLAPYVADQNVPLELRCAAAEAFGRLKFKAGSTTAAEAIMPIGAVAVAACTMEVNRITEVLDEIERTGESKSTIIRDGKQPVDPIVQTARRRLLAQLNCVGVGIDGLSNAVAGNGIALSGQIAVLVKTLQDLLSDDAKTMDPVELRTQIATTAKELERIVSR